MISELRVLWNADRAVARWRGVQEALEATPKAYVAQSASRELMRATDDSAARAGLIALLADGPGHPVTEDARNARRGIVVVRKALERDSLTDARRAAEDVRTSLRDGLLWAKADARMPVHALLGTGLVGAGIGGYAYATRE